MVQGKLNDKVKNIMKQKGSLQQIARDMKGDR